MATLEDLEARVAALEASQADYRAVLAAVNALGANQREHQIRLTGVETRLTVLGDLVRAPRRVPHPVDPDLIDQSAADQRGARLILDHVGERASGRRQSH